MNRLVVFAAAAITLYVGLIVLEQVRTSEPFDIVAFAIDIFEMALLAAAVLMTAAFTSEARDMRRERKEIFRDLRDARAESARWRAAARVHMDGLSRAIAAQFRAWNLTETEAEVAGLLLKGLSHKEIAAIRGTSETTIRQHATSVYRKSELSSRAQLTAFFLEDLLAPPAGGAETGLRIVEEPGKSGSR